MPCTRQHRVRGRVDRLAQLDEANKAPARKTPALSFSEIGNLQQLAVADPGFRQISLGLAFGGLVAACLVQFREPVIRPAIGRCPAQSQLELLLRLGMAAGPLVGGLIYDASGGYAWLYVGSAVLGFGAFLIAMTFRPVAKPEAVPAAA